MAAPARSDSVWRRAEEAIVAGDLVTLEQVLRDDAGVFRNERPQSWWNNTLRPDYEAGDARAIISRTHHFDSWDDFETFARELRTPGSPVARFEAAADAIVTGEIDTLRRLLHEHPELIRARSARNHHSTLLHYTGANGIEGWRQHTPSNAVDVLELLLASGAEVDGVADMYRGSTTLGLVATSLHPERAGLQEALIDVLLAHGARMDYPGPSGHGMPLVNGCLANGRRGAATYLAAKGAPLDLEAAGGVGRLDVLASAFDEGGGLKAPATPDQLAAALVSAAAARQHAAVRFLLDHGVPVDVQNPGSRFTGANWAALNADLELLTLFIERGADLEIENDYGGTALSAALWGAVNRPNIDDYPPVLDALIAAGARLPHGYADWWATQEARDPAAHAKILALLRAHEPRGS